MTRGDPPPSEFYFVSSFSLAIAIGYTGPSIVYRAFFSLSFTSWIDNIKLEARGVD